METLNNQWLSISDYANEYQVSISTLRRRIKNQQIPYKMIGGKYFIANAVHEDKLETFAKSKFEPKFEAVQIPKLQPMEMVNIKPSAPSQDTFSQRELIEELKKAYMSSLHDKEEQILTLKQQVADLKTLVMFLEKEISRVKSDF